MNDALPLSVLLSRVLGRITSEVEAAAGVGETMPSLAVWSNVLRCVGEGIDERDLPPAARISKRLAVAAVTGSARNGWVHAEPPKNNRRITLTELGARAAEAWPRHLAVLDATWNGTPLRAALENLVGHLRFELPHFPATYGTADVSAIGGPYAQSSFTVRKDDLPAHGNDWRPVPRGEGDTVSDLPITALLSQALMAYSIDYEDQFPWPLSNTMLVLRHVTEEPRPLDELPEGHGIKGNGKTLLERHFIVVVTKAPENPRKKLVQLHERGKQVLFNHPRRIETVEAEWRERYGSALMDELRAALDEPAQNAMDQPDHVVASLDQA